jgi:hypothetical protein
LAIAAALISCSLTQAQVVPGGSEFQVNIYTTAYQYDAAVVAGENGGFVVVWESDYQDGWGYSVQGRRYLVNGSAASGEFQVNSYTTGYQFDPEVAIDADGNFVVVWVSYYQDGSYESVHGQRYNADGSTAGDEFQVNTNTLGGQDSPAVGMSPNGDFVVVWESDTGDGSGDSVRCQLYNADGSPAGSEFQVNSYTTGDQDDPEVAVDSSGNFVVVWESTAQDDSGDSVQARIYTADGTGVTGELQVNSFTTGDQNEPRVVTDAGGSFVVVWVGTGQDGSSYSIHGQRFNADGSPAGDEFQVNSYTTGSQDSPAVASSQDGSFLVVWESADQDGSGDSVQGQLFSTDGAAVGDELQVNTHTTNNQNDPAVAADSKGRFVVAWDSYFQDNSSYGVFGQRLTPIIFTDDFETGGTSQWSVTVP